MELQNMEDKRQVLFPEVGCSRPRPRSSPPSWFSCPFGVLLNQQQFHWRHVEDIHLLFLFRVMRTKGHFLPQKKHTCMYIYSQKIKPTLIINRKLDIWHTQRDTTISLVILLNPISKTHVLILDINPSKSLTEQNFQEYCFERTLEV